jgi:hypothetical protein
MSWLIDKEKLLCFLLVDDQYAQTLSYTAGSAFFRAFIVQDRETGLIKAKFRFKYASGDRNWFQIEPKEQNKDTATRLRCSLEDVLREGAVHFGLTLPLDGVQCFYPPDDGGDPAKTVIWLEQQDLIEIVGVEES